MKHIAILMTEDLSTEDLKSILERASKEAQSSSKFEPKIQLISSTEIGDGTTYSPPKPSVHRQLDHYLLTIKDGATPELIGPYKNDDDRLDAACQHWFSADEADGIFRIDVPRGSEPRVSVFAGGELEEFDPFIDHVISMFNSGRFPIQSRVDGGKDFTVQYDGRDVLFSKFDLAKVSSRMRQDLFVQTNGEQRFLISEKSAPAFFTQSLWESAGADSASYTEWLTQQVKRIRDLPRAEDCITEIYKSQ
jgi:hypothetical protein